MTICYKKPRPIGPSMTPGRRGFDAGPNGWATRWVMRAQGKNSRCPRYSHYYSIHYLVGGSLYPSEIIRNLYFGQENAGRMSSLSNQSILPHTIPKHWLVVVYTPLKNMSSSVGIMKFPTEWKNIIHVPNHQADNEFWALLTGSTGFYISLARDGEGWNHIRTGHGLPTKNHAISRIRKTQQTPEHRDGSFLGPWINGYGCGSKWKT